MADSSTEAMPSITVPSPGITSPAATTTTSPRVSALAGFVVPSCSRATVCVRIARSVSACALPRPSAIASAKLPNSTVSHSQIATVNVNHAGSSPPPGASPPKAWTIQISVVSTAPISTTNMTGLRAMSRGSSLRERGGDRRRHDVALEQGALGTVGHDCASSASLSFTTFTDFGPPSPNSGRLVASSTRSRTCWRSMSRSAATRLAWISAFS